MKNFYKYFFQLFKTSSKIDVIPSKGRNFFDYSSGEKIKIMRAAGRQAQVEQKQLLKEYEARFGSTA